MWRYFDNQNNETQGDDMKNVNTVDSGNSELGFVTNFVY